jgi:hypothetical protein
VVVWDELGGVEMVEILSSAGDSQRVTRHGEVLDMMLAVTVFVLETSCSDGDDGGIFEGFKLDLGQGPVMTIIGF